MCLKQAQQQLDQATTKQDLYEVAGRLNNRPEHVHVDKVTFIALCDLEEGKRHVQRMINQSKGLV